MRARISLIPLAAIAAIIALMPALSQAQASSCNKVVYDTPGAYRFTVPAGVSSIAAKTWGGAGGSGTCSVYIGYGGAGGYSGGTVAVSPGQVLDITVGGGGQSHNNTHYAAGGFGGGGSSTGASVYIATAGGGGMSAIFSGGSPLLIAGGGGGGAGGGTASGCIYRNGPGDGCTFYQGGAGGGSSGSSVTFVQGGGNGGDVATGGTQRSGGAGGGPYTGESGSSYQGGNGTRVGAGGGGGYFGGGAGSATDPAVNMGYQSAGGGGSGFVGSGVSGGNTQGGNGTAPGNASDADRPWGVGEGNSTGAGGNGVVMLAAPNLACSAAPTCSVSFDQNPLTGQSTTIRWSSTDASVFYIKGIGPVSSSGSATVYASGDYSGAVSGPGGTGSCPATLAGPGGGSCVATGMRCSADGNLHDNCGAITQCQRGCSLSTNTCNTQCVPQRLCSADGTKVVQSCTGETIDDCAARGDFCSGGVCVAPPVSFVAFTATTDTGSFAATGHLQAAPSLLRRGQSSRLFWQVKNAARCTVSNGAQSISTALFSGAIGADTGPILGATTYTLHCAARTGAVPRVIDEQTTVNIVPIANEL